MKRGSTTALMALLVACTTACTPPAAPLASVTPGAALSPPQPSRVIYELREKCGKDAADWFKREHEDDTVSGEGIVTIQNEYTNHYNERLNRCYALVLKADFISRSKRDPVNLKSATLADVSENREVGKYFSNSDHAAYLKCSIGDHICGTFDEWQALAKPYMEQ